MADASELCRHDVHVELDVVCDNSICHFSHVYKCCADDFNRHTVGFSFLYGDFMNLISTFGDFSDAGVYTTIEDTFYIAIFIIEDSRELDKVGLVRGRSGSFEVE